MSKIGKHTQRHRWLRWGLGLAGAAGLICLGTFSYGKYQFNQNHFNQNVKINGIDVGRLTIAKATDKVNANSSNTVVLRAGRVRNARVGEVKAVTKNQVAKDFKKQYTPYDSNKHWEFASTSLKEAEAKLTQLNRSTLTYYVANKEYTLKPSDLFDTINYNSEEGFQFGDPQGVYQTVTKINKDVATLGKPVTLTTPDNQKISVKAGTYGWKVDPDKATSSIKQAIRHEDYEVEGQDDLAGSGYNTKGTGYGETANHGLGNNYVLISLKQQKLWVVKDGKPVVTLNDVVTGTADTSKGRDNRTPTGVYYIMYKQPNTTLKGLNDNGSKYASPVKYWMPFTEDGCGLHDASWRKDWGKQAYLEGGSHGCVNIKPSDIESVWQATFQNEPVVVYDN